MKTAAKPTDLLARDLERLESRAYGVADWAAKVLQRYHALAPGFHPEDAPLLAKLHAWIFAPPTLWPFSITQLMQACLARKRRLGRAQRLILELLPEVPDGTVCEAVAEHERQVQRGSYENVVVSQAKFAQTELMLQADPAFQQAWQQLKDRFEVRAHQDYKGVIRRTMGAERNLRPDFSVDFRRPDEDFRLAFDAFCLRWHLYGMQHDTPLLLKLSVNVTPHGTMIHIPSFWSFDPKRDIRWDAIARLHRVRAPKRQGKALAEGVAERMALAKKLRELDAQALRLGLRGPRKHRFLCLGLGWVEATSPKRLSRLRREFGGK